MLLHAFWWDVYIVFKKKKRETCAFLSHLIYSFTVYIVNNTASPYVECSIKHFYFNHLVGIFEKKNDKNKQTKKKINVCFPLAMSCVSDHRGEFQERGWHQAKGQTEKWMYHTSWETYGTYYLNVRERTFIIFLLSTIIWFCIFFLFFTFCIVVPRLIEKKHDLKKDLFCNEMYEVMDPCCCWNDFLIRGGNCWWAPQ